MDCLWATWIDEPLFSIQQHALRKSWMMISHKRFKSGFSCESLQQGSIRSNVFSIDLGPRRNGCWCCIIQKAPQCRFSMLCLDIRIFKFSGICFKGLSTILKQTFFLNPAAVVLGFCWQNDKMTKKCFNLCTGTVNLLPAHLPLLQCFGVGNHQCWLIQHLPTCGLEAVDDPVPSRARRRCVPPCFT